MGPDSGCQPHHHEDKHPNTRLPPGRCCATHAAWAGSGGTGLAPSHPPSAPIAAQKPLPAAASLPTPSGTGTSLCSLGGKARFCPHFSPSLSATQQGTGSARAAGTPQPLLPCHNGAHNPKQGLVAGISGTRVMNNPIKIGSTTSRSCSTPSPTARGQHPAPLLAGSSPLLPSMCSTRAGTLLLQSCSSAGWTLYCSTCSRRRAAAPRQSPA